MFLYAVLICFSVVFLTQRDLAIGKRPLNTKLPRFLSCHAFGTWMETVDDFDMELLVLAIPSYPPQGQGSYVRHLMFVDIEAPDLCEILSKVVRRVLMGRARGGGLISATYVCFTFIQILVPRLRWLTTQTDQSLVLLGH